MPHTKSAEKSLRQNEKRRYTAPVVIRAGRANDGVVVRSKNDELRAGCAARFFNDQIGDLVFVGKENLSRHRITLFAPFFRDIGRRFFKLLGSFGVALANFASQFLNVTTELTFREVDTYHPGSILPGT